MVNITQNSYFVSLAFYADTLRLFTLLTDQYPINHTSDILPLEGKPNLTSNCLTESSKFGKHKIMKYGAYSILSPIKLPLSGGKGEVGYKNF